MSEYPDLFLLFRIDLGGLEPLLLNILFKISLLISIKKKKKSTGFLLGEIESLDQFGKK